MHVWTQMEAQATGVLNVVIVNTKHCQQSNVGFGADTNGICLWAISYIPWTRCELLLFVDCNAVADTTGGCLSISVDKPESE